MRIYALYLCVLFGLSVTKAYAQKVKLTGVVTDSLNNPLELANVIAVNTAKNTMEAYAITNENGKYQMLITKGQSYLLRVSYLGYKEQELPITISNNDKELTKNIMLYEDKNKLAEVELVYEMPVTIKGDTLIYKTEAFTNGKEKKLKDVLKKLPGIEVAKDGSVKVQGKKVSKLMVEGKDFFDGDPKLATKNLPANAIDKVEVLRDYHEIQQTKGLGNDENIALNIKLKEGKKNLFFGDIEVGGGIEKKYIAHPNIFYYSPKTTLNFIGDLNNIGEQAFTLSDYFRFSGGLRSLMRKRGSSLELSSDALGISFLKDNRAKRFHSKLAALNFNHSFSKKFQFQGFLIASGNDTDLNTNTIKRYIATNPEQIETVRSEVNQKNKSGLVKLTATYEPNNNLYFNYDAIVKKGEIEERNNTQSVFGNIENNINALRKKEPFSINQNFETYYTLNPNTIFSFEAQHAYKEQIPSYNLITSQQPFIASLPLIDENALFNITQFKEVKTNKVESALNYYAILTKKSHFNITIGNVFLTQKLTSSITQQLYNTNQNTLTDDTFNNTVSYTFTDFFTAFHYKIKKGKFILNPGLNLHFFSVKDIQLHTINTQYSTKLLPDFYTKLSIKKSESLTFRYSLNTDFTGVDKRAVGTVITNYNSLVTGNRNITNDLYHKYSLQYVNFNMFSFTNISAMVNYSKKFDDVKSNIAYVGNDIEIEPVNAIKSDDYITMSGSFEKRFGKMKVKLESQVHFTNYNNLINSIESNSKTTTQNHKAALSSNFDNAPNFEIGFSKITSQYNNNGVKNTFFTDRPFLNIEIIFLKNFTLVADYETNHYRSKNKLTKSTYDFLNASLYYQAEGSKFEFKISGNNLTNTTSLNQDNFSDYVITASQYFVQPRFLMLTLKYDI